MKKTTRIISSGLAIFAILFGSGNIVFPLTLGKNTGNQVWWAIGGIFITAVLVPLLGLVSTALVDGQSYRLLSLLGKTPAMLITFICLMLIGPFGVIPRCITIAYGAVEWYLPVISLFVFSLLASAILFFFTYKKNAVIDIIGRFLGPLKLTLLLSIIVFGLMYALPLPDLGVSSMHAARAGIMQGLWTLDLLATIFFANLILANLKNNLPITTSRQLGIFASQAGIIGSLLLGFVYVGFCVVAAMYGPQLSNIADYQILTALASLILGPQAGILANITVAIACLTTAIALTTIFAEYIQRLTKEKINYTTALLITISVTTIMAHLGFAKIMNLIAPIVQAFYPALIVLAMVNILHQLYGFKWVKLPVFLTFVVTLGITYWKLVMTCLRRF